MHYYSRNYRYWYSVYCELKHLFFVIRWRKENLIPCARIGERIANDELILDDLIRKENLFLLLSF